MVSSVKITIKNYCITSPHWSTLYTGENSLGNIGWGLFIYGMYTGYPCREALDVLI